MKKIKMLFLIMLFVGISIVFAQNKKIILQNGSDGYTGCEDSYLFSGNAINWNKPSGDESELKLSSSYCSGG